MWTNKLIYLLVTLYAAVLAVLYSEVQALYVFIILLFLPVLLLLELLLVKQKIAVGLSADSKFTIEGSEGVHIKLTVQNISILPVSCIKIYLTYENAYVEGQNKQVFKISAGGRSKKQVDFVIRSEHVGIVNVAVAKVKVYDLIRLFSRKIQKKDTVKIEVPILPEVFNINGDIVITEPDFVESDVFSKNKPGDDPSEVFDIREYKEGDRIHRIHWKLSSKKDVVMVKDYSLPIANSATILVDTSLPDQLPNIMNYMDCLLETVAAVSYQLLVNDFTHFVAWYEQKESNYVSSNMEHLDDLFYMLNNLMQTKPTHDKNDILEAHQAYGEGKEISQVYYITHELTEEQIGILLDYYSHAKVDVLILGKEGENDEEEKLGQRLHQQYISIADRKASIEALHL